MTFILLYHCHRLPLSSEACTALGISSAVVYVAFVGWAIWTAGKP
jgi:hypothetical protein